LWGGSLRGRPRPVRRLARGWHGASSRTVWGEYSG
jgi:hypothetical protein